MPEWKILSLETPSKLAMPRREADQLWYEPSRLLAARVTDGDVGAIRYAVRQDRPDQGLVTDLVVEKSFRSGPLSVALIHEAEKKLRGFGVHRVEALVLDGQKVSKPFLEAGYIPFRLTVILGWDLTQPRLLSKPYAFEIEVLNQINAEEVAGFIFDSYQPYWQWWKETGEEQAIGRAEYPVTESTDVREQQRAANWDRVIAALQQFNTIVPQRLVIARQGGKIVGLCDAKADPEDSMDWGVLVSRVASGRAVGSALLGPALGWLRDQGLKTAQVTTTSGFDDYDPTVYLYVLVGGAQIRGEFLVLRKMLP